MATEIERKFLVINDDWRDAAKSSARLTQGYLTEGGQRSVRVRTKAGGKAFLNIKSSVNGISRSEYEYEIPYDDALEILENIALKPFIDKTRYLVEIGNHTWEVDEFSGENKGLVIAEVELGSEDEAFQKPAWAGTEVSGEAAYYNMNIASQKWRSCYPESLLLQFGGTVDPDNRFIESASSSEYADMECKDGC